MNALTGRLAFGLGAAVSALVVVLGLTLDWATWVWLPLAAVLGPGLAIVLRSMFVDEVPSTPPPPRPAPSGPPAPTPQQARVADLPVPTSVDDYQFLFSAVVSWVRDPVVPPLNVDLGTLATRTILERAVEQAREYSPENYALATVDLNAHLAQRVAIANGHYVWASEVTLQLPDADAERLHEIAKLRKDKVLWELRRSREIFARDYVGREVLSDPGTAVKWWFGRHLDEPDAPEKTVSAIADLRRLTSAAHAEETPVWSVDEQAAPAPAPPTVIVPPPPTRPSANPREQFDDAVDRLAEDLDPVVQATLRRRLDDVLRTYGKAAPDTASDPTVGDRHQTGPATRNEPGTPADHNGHREVADALSPPTEETPRSQLELPPPDQQPPHGE
ncbi:hypothetical protein [Saccharomonospora azurea]|uniref:Uncharacterized protein n=1 Tax=Saccharomonospora azurea NA-128 TaxID=882081 RepID=H8G785_9PSEU|nr:hypothetical protein [Saccharomonospora azurea]EHY88324.1 hypothetical protein SacazDRAFT_01394 [Saccharomonospora azurea NA-128]